MFSLKLFLITACLLALRMVYVTSSLPLARPKKLARGYGEHINWTSFYDGLFEAKTQRKPILLLIHQERCPACKDFGPRFAKDREIAEWSKYFTMINCKDEEEPRDKVFAPDGRYYPRILFMSPDGRVLLNVQNGKGSKGYRYYYFTAKPVVTSMINVAKMYYDLVYEDAEDL